MNQEHLKLFERTRNLLVLSQKDLGELSGASRRTVSRWYAGKSLPYVTNFQRLACAVHPRDPLLAADLAKAGQTTLAALGLSVATSANAPSVGAAEPKHVVDSVVCAAADANGFATGPTRAGLLAAVVRAKALGLSLDALHAGLSAPAPAAKR